MMKNQGYKNQKAIHTAYHSHTEDSQEKRISHL